MEMVDRIKLDCGLHVMGLFGSFCRWTGHVLAAHRELSREQKRSLPKWAAALVEYVASSRDPSKHDSGRWVARTRFRDGVCPRGE